MSQNAAEMQRRDAHQAPCALVGAGDVAFHPARETDGSLSCLGTTIAESDVKVVGHADDAALQHTPHSHRRSDCSDQLPLPTKK